MTTVRPTLLQATAIALVAAVTLSACQPSVRYLDEYVFLTTPQITLKLQRYHQFLPFSYDGEIYVVLCGSAGTRALAGGEDHPAGWRVIGRGAAIDSTSARELSVHIAPLYRVLGDGTVVWSHVPIFFALDACAHEVSWSPTTLPPERIVPTQRPAFCESLPPANCAMLDFQDQRLPRYSDIRVMPEGQISFRVESLAFAGVQALSVRSTDGGRTWSDAPLPPAPLLSLPEILAPCLAATPADVFGTAERLEWLASGELPQDRATPADDFEVETDASGLVLAARVELTGDDVPELILRGAAMNCGTGGCPFLVRDGRSGRALGELFGWRLWSAMDPDTGERLVCALSHLGAGRTALVLSRIRGGSIVVGPSVDLDDDQLAAVLQRIAPYP